MHRTPYLFAVNLEQRSSKHARAEVFSERIADARPVLATTQCHDSQGLSARESAPSGTFQMQRPPPNLPREASGIPEKHIADLFGISSPCNRSGRTRQNLDRPREQSDPARRGLAVGEKPRRHPLSMWPRFTEHDRQLRATALPSHRHIHRPGNRLSSARTRGVNVFVGSSERAGSTRSERSYLTPGWPTNSPPATRSFWHQAKTLPT